MNEQPTSLIDKLGGRKFLTTVVGLTAGCLVSVFSAKGLSPELVALIVGLTGTFHASNSFTTNRYLKTQEVTPNDDSVNKDDEPPVAATNYTGTVSGDLVRVVDHQEQLDRIEKTLGVVAQGVIQTQQLIIQAVQQSNGGGRPNG